MTSVRYEIVIDIRAIIGQSEHDFQNPHRQCHTKPREQHETERTIRVKNKKKMLPNINTSPDQIRAFFSVLSGKIKKIKNGTS